MPLEPIKALKSIPLFENFDLHVLSEIKEVLIRKKFSKSQIIFNEQDIGSDMFIVRSGQVKIISSGSDGKEVILALLTPGDFFGELSLLDSGPRSARAVASEKDTELLLLQRYDFMALLQKYPSVMQAVFKVLAQRLRKADEQIQDLIFADVKTRLVKQLLELAAQKGQVKGAKVTVPLRLTHKDLSEMIGSTRETVSRILQELFDDKGLEMTRKEMIVEVDNMKKILKKLEATRQ